MEVLQAISKRVHYGESRLFVIYWFHLSGGGVVGAMSSFDTLAIYAPEDHLGFTCYCPMFLV